MKFWHHEQTPKTLTYLLTKTPALYDEKNNPLGYIIGGTDFQNAVACIEHLVHSRDATGVRLKMSSSVLRAYKEGKPTIEEIVETPARLMTAGQFYGAYGAYACVNGDLGTGELIYERPKPKYIMVRITSSWLSVASAKNVKANLDEGYRLERYNPRAGKQQKHATIKRMEAIAYWTRRYFKRKVLQQNFKGQR